MWNLVWRKITKMLNIIRKSIMKNMMIMRMLEVMYDNFNT
jgi:hypothetical protein